MNSKPPNSNGYDVAANDSVVLLVDDQRSFRIAIERLLRRHGYRPLSVSNAALALRVLEDWPVSAVVADQRLGDGMDGLDLLERVPATMPRILLTGFPSDIRDVAERRGIIVIDKGDTSGRLLRVLALGTGRT